MHKNRTESPDHCMKNIINHTKVKQSFVYPDLTDDHYRFGSGLLVGEELRSNGDWRDYLPPEEDQNKRGVESSACFIEGQQHAIAIIEEEQLGEPNNNYSSRFNAKLSKGTAQGGNPITGADSIRHDGLVRDNSMPFSEDIQSWEDFHSWKGVNEQTVKIEGQNYLKKKSLGFDVVVERTQPIATKYLKMKQALKFSPLPASVSAWYEQDGIYVKPKGLRDNHLATIVYIDEQNRPYFWDTYAPYLKIGEPSYNVDFAMRWSVSRKQTTQVFDWNTFFQALFDRNKKW